MPIDTSLGGEKTTSISAGKSSDTAIGSGLSGDKISLTSGGDTVIRGSDVAAGNGLNLMAGGDITIEGVENYAESSYSHETTREGINGSFSGGRVGIGYNKSEQGREESSQSLWHSGSMVGSIDGTVNIYADRDVNIAGSQMVAGSGDVLISGREVTIENQLDEYDSQSRQWAEEKGLTISVGLSGAGSAIGSAISQGKDFLDKITQAKDSQSDRAKGLYDLAAGRDLYDPGPKRACCSRRNWQNYKRRRHWRFHWGQSTGPPLQGVVRLTFGLPNLRQYIKGGLVIRSFASASPLSRA